MTVTSKGKPISEEEKKAYVQWAKDRYPHDDIIGITIDAGDEFVDIICTRAPMKFDRIRRITGYLVGTTDRWNDAKRAELHDRVKHSV